MQEVWKDQQYLKPSYSSARDRQSHRVRELTARLQSVENLDELENEVENLTVKLYLEIHDPNIRKRQIGN